MICLFTDFGACDLYVGQMHQAIRRQAPEGAVIDLFHSAPAFNVRAGAYLAAHYCPPIAGAVYCCIVDPGVGGPRAAAVIDIDGCFYVGPDNGLFEILMRRFPVRSARRITWKPESMSSTFHGRDLFAPVAARLSLNQPVEAEAFQPRRFGEWPDDADEIIYIDHYGNAITGMHASKVDVDQIMFAGGTAVAHANSFGEVPLREAFWYENANGLVEIAVNQGSADRMLNLQVGSPVRIVKP